MSEVGHKLPSAYLCLGSNLGDREKNLTRALSLLSQELKLEKVSSIYETEPVGYKEQPLFLNMVCQGATNLNPQELLSLAKAIESRMGRAPSFPNAPRPIDIDILFYDNKIIKTKDLTIPHPRLTDRAFVLVPLAEIAPELVHPELGKSITELASNIKGYSEVRKYN
ncbi:MAG: 2-amino-4-hydroxy-6-hydroxymethyldihydropteridine diphosphokinase [Dehalococcoidia bacterium]|nr:2-amino-4-hydroxy-6-hydroxymethyldihydropteridine diphosphokinase [Dehalococcoidia bacterium]